MQPIIPCTRCGYATARAFPRCWCCGRPLDQCRRRRSWSFRLPVRLHLHRKPSQPKEDLAELLAAW